MKQPLNQQPILQSPVTGVSGVWKFKRDPGGYHRTRSLPGHLLHLVLTGSYQLRCNAREYGIKPMDVIYYHETEEVEWLGNKKAVTFYSVGFLAPELPPLAPEHRVFPSTGPIRKAFHDLHAASLMGQDIRRAAHIHSALLKIIVKIDWGRRPEPGGIVDGATVWWQLERLVRERRQFRWSLDDLAAAARCSRATVVRTCRAATGMSPMHRLQDIRMEEAKGLLRFSSLNITQISEYLGYGRLHEFSREYSRFFGHPPTATRNS